MSEYVIVGAGTAGCALAARLSADGTTVTLLECGPHDRRPEVRVPAAFPRLFGTEYDWAYTTVPQDGLGGRSLYWPRGRTLGGSSAINAQIWTRGHPADYDDWDIPGWTYKDLLPYFERAERRAVRLEALRAPHPSTGDFLDACARDGMAPLAAGEGYGPVLVTQHRGRRWSSADAYLRPALDRPNLTVVTGADVRRIRLAEGRASGVEYRTSEGEIRHVAARREVIVSAGAVGSPVLLMRSGIGDPGGQEDVTVPLPEVGRHLLDHLMVPLVFGPGARAERVRPSSNNAEALAFLRSPEAALAPDLEFLWMPVPFLDHGRATTTGTGCTLAVILLHPASHGRITLHNGEPHIDPRYLTDPSDLRTLLTGVQRAHRLLTDPALATWTGEPLTPAAQAISQNTPWNVSQDASRNVPTATRGIPDAARGVPQGAARGVLEEAVRRSVETLYHPVGTCRIGVVVDERLRVHGVRGLRVADVSVCPAIPRAHTQAVAVVIGERAADLILEESR